MGTTQEEWDWEITCDSWWDDTPAGEERCKLYSMQTHRSTKRSEPILIFFRDFEVHVTRWYDEVAEDRWPITRDEEGFWMRLPEDPRDELGDVPPW